MPQDEPKVDRSHVSRHFLEGKPETHAIAQQIKSEGKTKIAYTDVDHEGNVGESGFDEKKD